MHSSGGKLSARHPYASARRPGSNPRPMRGQVGSNVGGNVGGREDRGTRQVATSVQRPTWQDRGFYIQIERCAGVESTQSVRHDEEKYVKYSLSLRDGIDRFFDSQIPVEIVNVTTLYAMEVRVMPEECHPRNGRTIVAQDAHVAGGHAVFSKIESKKWPKLENVIKALQEFCRIPVRITALGRELKAAATPESSHSREVHRAVNGHDPGGAESLAPLRRVVFHCTHTRGEDIELHTSAEGKVEMTLFPGNFTFSFQEGSEYDKLNPSTLVVPARFSAIQATITASMKKKCTLFIVDHLNRPFPLFPLRLTHRDPKVQPVVVRTKVDGKCRARLGRGFYMAEYAGDDEVEHWPVTPLAQQLEVHDTDVPQFFRVNVRRVRFTCEIMLRTRFEEPAANCPFRVKSLKNMTICTGVSTDIGLAICDVPSGQYTMKLEPPEELPYVQMSFDVNVFEDGTFQPLECKVQTKVTDVKINLVTPDGEPAPDCVFYLEPQFLEAGVMGRAREMRCHADEKGVAIATMGLLEPYIFRVKATNKAAEYMPQQFVFQTSRRDITAVVARSIFGPIHEDRVALVIDTSGSMQAYLDDVKVAVNSVITQQFYKSKKLFNILTYTSKSAAFRPDLVDCSQLNVEDAMRFCDAMEAGGSSEMLRSIEHAFRFPTLEALYVVTDGKCDLKDEFLNQLRALFFTHPKRPKVNTIGINCIPQRLTWQGLQAMALLTQGKFRAVCLEQSAIDVAARPAGFGEDSVGFSAAAVGESVSSGLIAAPGAEMPATTTDEERDLGEDEDTGYDTL
mmetsp:Transcript_148439/g.262024  ORF Transcript_148439/g.262024 Transcript_148439/m.262024 type:complete len:792 (-) Transcript_148439:106-2481(-)